MLLNRSAIAILVCALCAPLLRPSAAIAGTYQSPNHPFSLTLPDDWRPVDPATFEKLKAASLAQGKQVETLETIYQVWENGVDQPAVLTITYHALPNESLAEIAAAAEKEMTAGEDRLKLAERYSLSTKDGMTDLDVSYPTVTDAKRQLVRAEFVAEYRNKARMHALTFYKPGREGVVHLGFLVLQSGYEARRPALDQIASSIAFAPGHELQPGAQKANLAKAETWNNLRGCGWALFYCVGFAVMVFTASWVRHKFG